MSNLNYNLSTDQRRIIDMYVTQYNQTNTHIERLLDMLDEIRNNIQNIIISGQPRSNRISRNSRYSNAHLNRYINRLLNENRPSYQSIYYDYNTPINPSLYSDINNNNQNSNIFRNNDLSSFFNNFLNTNVTVRPTNEQLQNASQSIRYRDIESPLSETCPISLERFDIDEMVMQIIPCGHIFCESQFQEWFENNVRCPVCRYDIRNYRSSNRNETNNSTETPIQPTHIQPTQSTTTQSTSNTDSSFSNISVLRDPETNEIDQLGFDITNTNLANNIIENITNRLFQSILFPSSTNSNNDRFVMDPSNNILLYETIIRPNFINNNNNNNNNSNINRQQ